MKQLYAFPAEELQQPDTVYISIAEPLDAITITNDKHRIQLKKAIEAARQQVAAANPAADIHEKLNSQLDIVAKNDIALTSHEGGLALYVTPENIYYYHLTSAPAEQVTFGSFANLLPLAENFQFTKDYHLLVLNREGVSLFEAHGAKLQEIDMTKQDADAPVDLETALGTDVSGGELNFGSYSGGTSGKNGSGAFHGQNEVSQEKDIDRERYFNLVDQFITANYSNTTKLPLILFTTKDNEAIYRKVSDNQYLSAAAINGSGSGLDTKQIAAKAVELINDLAATEQKELLERLKEATPENKIQDRLEDLAGVSIQGRIEALYLEKGYQVNGTITEDGIYQENDEANDFVQKLAQNVLQAKGNVYIFDQEALPEDTHLAARLRY